MASIVILRPTPTPTRFHVCIIKRLSNFQYGSSAICTIGVGVSAVTRPVKDPTTYNHCYITRSSFLFTVPFPSTPATKVDFPRIDISSLNWHILIDEGNFFLLTFAIIIRFMVQWKVLSKINKTFWLLYSNRYTVTDKCCTKNTMYFLLLFRLRN